MIRGDSLLTSASGRGDTNSVRYLLQNGADVNMKSTTGETALTSVIQFAAHPRILEVVELLLSFSAGIHPVQIKICRVPSFLVVAYVLYSSIYNYLRSKSLL